MCAGLLACPFFAATMGWARASACPHAAAAGRPFSHGLFPSSPGGAVPLNAVCQEGPTGASPERLARRLAAQLLYGGGQWHSGRLYLQIRAPSCTKCTSPGWGMSRGCPAGHKGHTGPRAYGSTLPEGPAPGRAKTPGARPRGPARRSGRAILLAGAGPPGLPRPPGLGPNGVAPLHGPSQYAGHPPILYVEA